ncbi:universal stress protein [Yoonia sp. R2331]|uniref:universal stress protein n=1 Tax=Yoonia sp. R2331 TaxID=3237238 RepID=UPI0034E5590A
MYKNILVPVLFDQDHPLSTSFEVARAVADKDARFTVLNVLEAIPAFAAAELPAGTLEAQKEAAKGAVEEAAAGLPNAQGVVKAGHAGRAIVDYATAQASDSIIIASHKPGLEDYFLGSTAARVVRHAPCAVHVIR